MIGRINRKLGGKTPKHLAKISPLQGGGSVMTGQKSSTQQQELASAKASSNDPSTHSRKERPTDHRYLFRLPHHRDSSDF